MLHIDMLLAELRGVEMLLLLLLLLRPLLLLLLLLLLVAAAASAALSGCHRMTPVRAADHKSWVAAN